MPGAWAGTAEAYATSFALLCAGAVDPLLDAVELRMPGRGTLLDVGTGPGTVAHAAASRGWRVAASDPEQDMLAVAERGGGGVRYARAALPGLPHPDAAFDAVTANFVVNHTARPRDAIAELARVARGVVALTIWPRGRTVLNGLWSGVVADAGAVSPPGTALAPGDDIDRTEEGLAAELAAAGLIDVVAATPTWDFAIAPEVLWRGVAGGAGTIGTTYRAQDDPTRARMHDAYLARTAELVGADGVLRFPTAALLGVGSVAGRG
ncbi:class I SAM-dependent methyltransferase [Pseudolysinimonas sp.]|uniref:class I SAM-dependent methyltransferase n=1 Tax=Pseudolysinimonas sp. TaxID=2680009 RepID=UPI003F7DAE16